MWQQNAKVYWLTENDTGAVAFLEPWELSFPWCSIGEHV
jgi:hypothetical protein